MRELIAGELVELRRPRVEHAEAMGRAITASIEHLRPWMPWIAQEPMSLEERREFLAGWEREWDRGGDMPYVVFLDGELVGTVGLHRRIGPGGLEIGYWVAVTHLRRGIATEAARLATGAAFEVPGIERVEIHHDKANEVSGRVPARLGFELVAERRDGPTAPADLGIERVWRMTRERWLSSPARGPAKPS